MKKLHRGSVYAVVVFYVLLLSGCSVFGTTEYSIEPVLIEGKIVCCKAHIYNSKDYDKLKFTLKRNKDGTMEVTLDEKGVSASDPATIASENNGKMLDILNNVLPLTKD